MQQDKLDSITPLILTFNEAANLQRTLDCLRSFKEVVVLDSGSTDATSDIASSYPNVRFFTRPFDNFCDHWNFGHTLTSNKWILSLDADYQVSAELLQEISKLDRKQSAYQAGFVYYVFGKPIRGTIMPPRVILYDKEKHVYIQDGHTQRLKTEGTPALLRNPIIHDDRKSLSRWLQSQQRYASDELIKLTAPGAKAEGVDKLRMKTWIAPLLVFWYTLLIKGAIFSGRRGVFYALQRMYAELLFLLKRMEQTQASDEPTSIHKP